MKLTLAHMIAIAVLLLMPLPSIAAESESRDPDTLDEYIHYALENSASLKGAFEAYSAATQRSPQVTALSDPKLTYGYFIQSVETRVGPQRHKVGVAQSFPWFGTLTLRGDVADAEAKAEMNRFLALKNKLVFQVTKTYTEIAYVDAAIGITKETMQLVQSWENVLQERFRTSTGSHSDLIRVQVELGKLEDRLLELKDLRTPLTTNLNSLLNREPALITKITPNFLSLSSKRAAQTISFENVLAGNPELLMLDAVIEAREKGVRLAEKKFYPDFTVGVDYIVTGDRDVADGGDDAVLGMVSINVPLYWKKNRAAVREAKARQRSFEQIKRDREFQLRSELSRASYELRDSKRKISLYKNTLIPKTQESIEASYTAYEAGDRGFLDVIDSEERLLDFQLTLKRAQADNVVAVTKLEKLAGNFNKLPTDTEEK